MSNTRAVEVSIHAVSPLLIWSASTRYGAVAMPVSSADWANAREANAPSIAVSAKFLPLMRAILANGKPWDIARTVTISHGKCAPCLTKSIPLEHAPAWRGPCTSSRFGGARKEISDLQAAAANGTAASHPA
jgi:hypothetical protein